MMLESVLFYVHYALLLLFGVYLSAAFAGVRLTTKNTWICLALAALCGALQIAVYACFSEASVWKLYPLITHLPLALLLCLFYRKRVTTALAAICTAYLCCQPAKWFGVFLFYLTGSPALEACARILMLLASAVIALKYAAPYISEIFSKDTRSVCIFGITPVVYYVFDYAAGIYTDFWATSSYVAAEFIPCLLCVTFMLFCLIYHAEYEQKSEAEQKEQIVRVIVEQQAREIEAAKRSEQEIRLLRHDMRLHLNSLALCIETGDREKALQMLSAYASYIEGTTLEHFCENDTVNYVLSDFSARCRAKGIDFSHTVELDEFKADDLLFSSILSNSLDNALNAQDEVPPDRRSVRLLLKNTDGKLLLSVKNPVSKKPVFADGLPISSRDGHGYGTRSIRYMTERLGGNCQFLFQEGQFILRVIL